MIRDNEETIADWIEAGRDRPAICLGNDIARALGLNPHHFPARGGESKDVTLRR